jgi:hypothetical protein
MNYSIKEKEVLSLYNSKEKQCFVTKRHSKKDTKYFKRNKANKSKNNSKTVK